MTSDHFTTDVDGAAHFEADRSALAAQDARDDARRDAQGDGARPDGGGEAVESTRTPVDDPWAPEIAALHEREARDLADERFSVLATPSDAHREWHFNTGIPVGLPGCPQDACHVEDPSEVRRLVRQRNINWALMRGEIGEATIACGRCTGIHLAVRYVRECDGDNRQPY